MLAVIATLKVQDGKAAEFESVMKELAAQVKATEPGNISYKVGKSRTEPNTYKVLEVYADEDAFKTHGRTDHLRAAGAKFAELLAGRPEVEQLDGIA
ncbi:MAG: putative quinol monooxygenase [Caulobacter sp.]